MWVYSQEQEAATPDEQEHVVAVAPDVNLQEQGGWPLMACTAWGVRIERTHSRSSGAGDWSKAVNEPFAAPECMAVACLECLTVRVVHPQRICSYLTCLQLLPTLQKVQQGGWLNQQACHAPWVSHTAPPNTS